MAKQESNFSNKRRVKKEVSKALEALQDDEEPKKRGRKKKKLEPHQRLNVDVPVSRYKQFQNLVEIHDGDNMSIVINRMIQGYIEEKEGGK